MYAGYTGVHVFDFNCYWWKVNFEQIINTVQLNKIIFLRSLSSKKNKVLRYALVVGRNALLRSRSVSSYNRYVR